MPRQFTLRQRMLLWLASWAGHLAIRAICSTMTFEYSVEEGGTADFFGTPIIYSFWHRCVFSAAYCYRNHNIQVMTSASFDGEIIARETHDYAGTRPRLQLGGNGQLMVVGGARRRTSEDVPSPPKPEEPVPLKSQ